MKRIVAAALCAVLPLLAGGCSFSDLSFDNMLRPPKTMGDEADIEKLISASAPKGYILNYPKNGNYRSAIIMNDLDGDDINEAIAFFREKDSAAGIHTLIMSEDEDGWKVAGDFITEATDVDCVDFCDIDSQSSLEILVGYSTYTPNFNFLSCYTFENGRTDALSAGQNYSSFVCGNLDSAGKNEVVTLSLFSTEVEAKATLLEYDEKKNALYAKAAVSLDPNVVRFRSLALCDLAEGVKGITVDGASASEEYTTQLIFYNKDMNLLRNPLYREKVKNPTQRTSPLICSDIDNDRITEIPVVEKLPYSGQDAAKTVADKVTWCVLDYSKETLTPKLSAIVNYDYSYSIRVPQKWTDGSYTANITENSMIFREWNKSSQGDNLFEIKAFDVTMWDQGKETDDYELIYKDNRYAYALRNLSKSSDLSITNDEIKTAFSVLNALTA